MRHVRSMILSAAILALAGCGPPGEVYQRPVPEVRNLLRTVEVPLYMFGSADTQVSIDGSDPAQLRWTVTADDNALLTFIATLLPAGDAATRVIVDLEGTRTGKYGDVQARLEKMREIRHLYLVSMTEAVDSTLDGRAFDIAATYPALMSATAANAGRLVPPSTGKQAS